MAQIIRATEVVRSFSDIMNRVYYKGESFDIQKGHNIVARISPIENKPPVPTGTLKEFLKNAPKLDPDDAEQFIKDIDDIRRSTRVDIKKLYQKWD
ncbi:antitoxin [Rickettsia endosymbiont of Polydrusus tereticollis]|uniref:antitoxin n=1 Tax=Rickettsia endosymbiont of Polydrusus tereticollis TaxID=3066251 RepID=UPI003132B3F8|nr:antitoxin [Rickettsia endosymbiont of Oxypoda opaca]